MAGSSTIPSSRWLLGVDDRDRLVELESAALGDRGLGPGDPLRHVAQAVRIPPLSAVVGVVEGDPVDECLKLPGRHDKAGHGDRRRCFLDPGQDRIEPFGTLRVGAGNHDKV